MCELDKAFSFEDTKKRSIASTANAGINLSGTDIGAIHDKTLCEVAAAPSYEQRGFFYHGRNFDSPFQEDTVLERGLEPEATAWTVGRNENRVPLIGSKYVQTIKGQDEKIVRRTISEDQAAALDAATNTKLRSQEATPAEILAAKTKRDQVNGAARR